MDAPACITIRARQLSRALRAEGAAQWTHIWEQEFSDLDGLGGRLPRASGALGSGGPLVRPGVPEVVVRDRICHSYCVRTEPVLT